MAVDYRVVLVKQETLFELLDRELIHDFTKQI